MRGSVDLGGRGYTGQVDWARLGMPVHGSAGLGRGGGEIDQVGYIKGDQGSDEVRAERKDKEGRK